MNWLDIIRSHVLGLPDLAKFAVVVAVFVGVPTLARRLAIPEMVGLLLFGVLLGPHVLEFFGQNRPIANFFAELGKLLLMFSAGLETDVDLFRKVRWRAVVFGVVTTATPLVLGILCGLSFGYGVIPAVVIGSLLASHTLLSLPIVARLGASKMEPIVVAIGATVISDTLSLIVFAVCVSTYTTGFSWSGIAVQLIEIAIFVPLILIGLSRAGSYLLRKVGGNEEGFFVIMLGVMAVAGMIADLINLPGIVGAFLAGLAVNGSVQEHPAKAKLEFFANSLFVPSFFIVTGFLIAPIAFARSVVGNFPFVAGIVAALLAGKGIAAAIVGRAFHYSGPAQVTVWALTLPQVAATLAAALVARETFDAAGQPLLDGTVLNAVLVLMVVTSVMGPVLIKLFATRMLKDTPRTPRGRRTSPSIDRTSPG